MAAALAGLLVVASGLVSAGLAGVAEAHDAGLTIEVRPPQVIPGSDGKILWISLSPHGGRLGSLHYYPHETPDDHCGSLPARLYSPVLEGQLSGRTDLPLSIHGQSRYFCAKITWIPPGGQQSVSYFEAIPLPEPEIADRPAEAPEPASPPDGEPAAEEAAAPAVRESAPPEDAEERLSLDWKLVLWALAVMAAGGFFIFAVLFAHRR